MRPLPPFQKLGLPSCNCECGGAGYPSALLLYRGRLLLPNSVISRIISSLLHQWLVSKEGPWRRGSRFKHQSWLLAGFHVFCLLLLVFCRIAIIYVFVSF